MNLKGAWLNAAGKYAANNQSGWNNGISKQDGFEAYADTGGEIPTETYEVEPAMAEAIAAIKSRPVI